MPIVASFFAPNFSQSNVIPVSCDIERGKGEKERKAALLFSLMRTALKKANKFLGRYGFGFPPKEEYYYWKQVGKALLCTYTVGGLVWLWDETSPLGWWTLKPRPKEEKELAHLYERRKYPYPGDTEAVEEFIKSGGTIGTVISPKGYIEVGVDAEKFQKQMQSKKLEQESMKLWLRMRNEVVSELQEKGYDVE